jgi:mono/diheme cytochrome c family protein
VRPATLAILVLGVPAAACGQSAGQWRDSAHIWRSLCRYCHATTIAPPLLGLPLPTQLTITTVRGGRNAMPAFTSTQINDAELRDLAIWIAAQPVNNPGPRP